MKWVSQDIEQYLKAQEYIDTAVIPLISVSFETEMKQSASMNEFIMLISSLIERQYTGRVLLPPPFTYLTTESYEKHYSELSRWQKALKKSGLKHLFMLTCDSEWKMYEEKLNDVLIWIPAFPLENLEYSQKNTIVESQVQQIFAILSRKWQEYR